MTRSLPAIAKAARAVSPMLVAGLFIATGASAHEIRALGDGKYTSAPRAGYLMSCQTRFNPNAPGSHRTGNWVQGSTYNLGLKPTVSGSVNWPNAQVTVTREGNTRIIRANNLPTHPTGVFPIASDDDAYQYDRNPGRIRAQNILLRLPADPEVATSPSCVPMGMIGFTLVGGALYNALDARGRDAAAYEILDRCGGHPQQNGQYHYHDYAACLPSGRDGSGHGALIGYALDGFGIFGPYDSGREMTNANLDECHGHVGPVMWDGEIADIYHYHMNDEYPYSIGCFKGTPVNAPRLSAAEQPPQGADAPRQPRQQATQPPQDGRGQQPPAGPRGNDPIVQIAAELGVDANALRDAVGPPPPNLQRAAQQLGIGVEALRSAFRRHRPH